MFNRAFYLSFLTLFFLVSKTHATNETIPNLDAQQVKVDGLLSEDVWQRAHKIAVQYETFPRDNAETPKEYETNAFLFEDGSALYIAVDAKDPSPDKIKANYYKRDQHTNDDLIRVAIDPFGQAQQAYYISVNPLGGQADHISLARNSVSWDGFWESKGVITKDGFQLEIKIPLSNFRYPNAEWQNWAIQISRTLNREQGYKFQSNMDDRDNDCRMCLYTKYKLLKNAEQPDSMEIRAYGLATQTKSKNYPYNETFNSEDDYDAGIDLKYSPSANHVINGTINPDFSQIEADDAQFEANKLFSIYYSEKRPFFLEGANYFDTTMDLIYTRNIVDPKYGAKYTGKSGSHVVGAFFVNDEQTIINTPGLFGNSLDALDQSSNNSAIRYRYDIGKSNFIGASATHRSSDDYSNSVQSIDGFYRASPSHRIGAQITTTSTEFSDEEKSGIGAKFNYNYNTETDWHWFSYERYDADFDAGMSFIRQNGYESANTGIGHLWQYHNQFLNYAYLSGWMNTKYSLETTNTERRQIAKQFSGEIMLKGKNRFTLIYTPSKSMEYYNGSDYSMVGHNFMAQYEPITHYIVRAWTSFGDSIDYLDSRAAESSHIGLRLTANITPELYAKIEHIDYDLKASTGKLYDGSIINTTINYSLDFKHHFRIKSQYRKLNYYQDNYSSAVEPVTKDLGYQLLYLYQPSSRTNVYIGYSSNSFEDINLQSLEEYNRYLFVKFNYAFSL